MRGFHAAQAVPTIGEAPEDDCLARLGAHGDDAQRTRMHPHATPGADPVHAPCPTHRHAVDVPAGGSATAARGTPELRAPPRAREDRRGTRDAPYVIRPVSAQQSARPMVLHAPETRVRPRGG